MRNKIFGILICMLFIGTCIPTVFKNVDASRISNDNTIFFDDFDDNEKDFSKWTELYNDGEWWEQNQRTEFQCYEHESPQYKEGIQSEILKAIVTSDQSVKISVKMFSDIEHNQTWQSIGRIILEVSDGSNWIKATYARGTNELRYRDSNDYSETVIGYRDDGTWMTTIEIFSTKYKVDMDSDTSSWISDSIFSSNSTIVLKIYIECEGSTYDFWWRAGFDNVIVEGLGGGNNEEIIIDSISGSFGVSAVIKNIGTTYATNVSWFIDVEPSIGLILSGGHTEDVIDELAAGGTDTIHSIGLRGIGRISISVQVADAVKQATAFLLGPLVLRVNEV